MQLVTNYPSSVKLLIKMKKNNSRPIAKKKLASSDSITGLRQALFVLKLEQRAGRMLKTHQIKQIKRKIARSLTKQNQQKLMTKNESLGGEI